MLTLSYLLLSLAEALRKRNVFRNHLRVAHCVLTLSYLLLSLAEALR